MYLVLAAQQALPAYYFLTAFAPSPSLVGRRLNEFKDFEEGEPAQGPPAPRTRTVLQAKVKVDRSVC